MALAHPMLRSPDPLWDEQVVPALRKRLESESRTLSKRMSAISLSPDDVPMPPLVAELSTTRKTQKHARRGSSSNGLPSSPLAMETSYSASGSSSTSRANSNAAKNQSTYDRARTYSQPQSATGSAKSVRRDYNGRSEDALRARPSELRPTRIPKPSRAYGGSSSNGNTPTMPQTNGFTTPTPSIINGSGHRRSTSESQEGGAHLASSTTRSTIGLPTSRSASGLMNESPPFPSSTSTVSLAYSSHTQPSLKEGLPSQPSADSEERPFEHWYRGEVSRNGGVGELRVGRQQEMLEIANYGHMLRNQRQPLNGWNGHIHQPVHRLPVDDGSKGSRHRKRADSIAGLTDVERSRGSILFDEEGISAVGRVLDEHPLTDIDGEESDIASVSSQRFRPDYILGVGDITISTALTTPMHSMQMDDAMDERSTTPTAAHPPAKNAGPLPPTRIPSRAAHRSSESRSSTPTIQHSISQSAALHSRTPKTPSPPPIITTSSIRAPSVKSMATMNSSYSSGPSNPSSAGKRVASPSTPSKRRTPAKSLRGRQTAPHARKDASKDREPRSQYPSPGDGEDMADAIPTWTQPVPKTGNWDEVVLPVVARQKGLEDFYEDADGSPQPKKENKTVAPAPGTFGFDESKIRRKPGQSIEMRDLERPVDDQPSAKPPTAPTIGVENTDEFKPYEELYLKAQPQSQHDRTTFPVRSSPPPSPAPFSHYAPNAPVVMQQKDPWAAPKDPWTAPPPDVRREPVADIQEKDGAGCCKCTIM